MSLLGRNVVVSRATGMDSMAGSAVALAQACEFRDVFISKLTLLT